MQASTARFEAGKSPAITPPRGLNWPRIAVRFARGTSVCDDRPGEALPPSRPRNDPRLFLGLRKGWRRALEDDPHLRAGLNAAHGHTTHPAVGQSLAMEVQSFDQLT
jgi:hypothetical protein